MSTPTELDLTTYYGNVPLDRVDIRGVPVWSIDLRAQTGGVGMADETQVLTEHPFTLSVFAPTPGEHATGEVRLMLGGREVRLVGHLTGRPGVVEMTPDHVFAASQDPAFLDQLRTWLAAA